MFKFVPRGDGGLSKAHIARHSSPTPLVHVIISMVANHAPSVPILTQFPRGSMSVNLACQLSKKTLKSSYLFLFFVKIYRWEVLLKNHFALPKSKTLNGSQVESGFCQLPANEHHDHDRFRIPLLSNYFDHMFTDHLCTWFLVSIEGRTQILSSTIDDSALVVVSESSVDGSPDAPFRAPRQERRRTRRRRR